MGVNMADDPNAPQPLAYATPQMSEKAKRPTPFIVRLLVLLMILGLIYTVLLI
jgi:hypothetical protein